MPAKLPKIIDCMYEILPNVWLGNGSAGRNTSMLLNYGITNLLQVGDGLKDM